jgi:hypothetical protein
MSKILVPPEGEILKQGAARGGRHPRVEAQLYIVVVAVERRVDATSAMGKMGWARFELLATGRRRELLLTRV